MWMFRWLQRLIARARIAGSADHGWVEPSNAITRAILNSAVPQLPMAARTPVLAESADPALTSLPAAQAVTVATAPVPGPVHAAIEVDAPERTQAQPATRTAQRTRRRRASRAA
jgi:hypothetical protein